MWEQTEALKIHLRGLRPNQWDSMSGDDQAKWLQNEYMHYFRTDSQKCESLCQAAIVLAIPAAESFGPAPGVLPDEEPPPEDGEPPASSMTSAVRLAQQLAAEEMNSGASAIFTESGELQPSVIRASQPIIPGTSLTNLEVIERLTSDGSNLGEWAKRSTPTFESPTGPFRVHFYYNESRDEVYYGMDYKVKFNPGHRRW